MTTTQTPRPAVPSRPTRRRTSTTSPCTPAAMFWHCSPAPAPTGPWPPTRPTWPPAPDTGSSPRRSCAAPASASMPCCTTPIPPHPGRDPRHPHARHAGHCPRQPIQATTLVVPAHINPYRALPADRIQRLTERTGTETAVSPVP
ncbi:hypothetical protein ACR6C2_40380 [Streptomyces sp. INA 01156]